MQTECRDCGAVIEYQPIEGWEHLRPGICNACGAQRDRERRKHELTDRLTAAGIPAEYWTWDPDLGNNELLRWCLAHLNDSMCVSGLSGICKTRAFCRAAVVALWREPMLRAYYCPTTSWLPDVTMNMGLDPHEAQYMVHRACRVPLLILDDLGQEAVTERGGEILFRVIDTRMREGRTLWVTSNASQQEFEDKLGAKRAKAILRRLRENCWEFGKKRQPLRGRERNVFAGLDV